MSNLKLNSSQEQIADFKASSLWKDISRELKSWKRGFNIEMSNIVNDAESGNPSTASVLLHMGDLNGRQKAVDYFLSILDVFSDILETQKEDKEMEDQLDE